MAKNDNFKKFYAVSFAWQLGFLIIFSLGGFMFLGLEADKYFNTNPLFLIIGLIVGLVVSIYETYHMLIPIIKTEEKE
jgi:F0F1-type ATP synthase assembly protein I